MSTAQPAAEAPTLIEGLGSSDPEPEAIPGDGFTYFAGEPEDLTGQVLNDRYRLLEKLGEGGMAEVYLAEHIAIGKRCAIKLMFAEHCHKQDLIDRFLQEARAASAIEHENVVEITDFGRAPNGSVYFAMEYLAGEDLADTLERERRLPWYRVRGLAGQLCQALAAAHAKGIVHRDLKPENCFRITRGGNPDFIKVLDFGIAKIVSDVGDGGKGLTRTGSIFGTPEYMSPEQAAGEKVDRRADIYSLGVILYELLTGHTPFTAENYMGVLAKHMFEAPVAPRVRAPEADIPAAAEAVILKAMQKDRDLRFQDMVEFAAAIEAVGTGAPAVVVVDEELPRPTVETMMNFAEGAVTEQNRWMVTPQAVEVFDPGPRPKRTGYIAGGVGFVVFAIALGAWVIGGTSEPPMPPPEPKIEKVVVAAPVLPVEPEAEDTQVSVTIRTNVDADVLDARDRAKVGQTNSTGLELEKRDEPYPLLLVAEGHEEMAIDLVADSDREVEYTLAKQRNRKRRGKKKSRKKSSKQGSSSGLRLKDPFNK